MITFGLVALLGAWHDPLHSAYVAFGLSALLALVFIGLASRAAGRASVELQPDALHTCGPREMRRAWALRELLEFIRRAHLSCGAPPRRVPNHTFPTGGGSMHRSVHRALTFFDSGHFRR
ncbi:MAG: hypothetical protein RMN52_01950 [Anaerolineae bacterium]|nr:hypothetical protein [Candidatus Roseilinea sp.]MDW8448743.1 hypothetical protein [Anaerolineae bacterium]